MASSMTLTNDEQPGPRSSSGSGRSSRSRPQNQQQQLSQIEKSVTHLLVATKQLLETLTHWSRGGATESEVSDVYVRLGYEFNIACRAFNTIGVETQDLGPVPDLLRGILEETLSQEASQASLDRFLPRIRDIIINLLHGLKQKQQRLRSRQRSGRDIAGVNGASTRQGSVASTGSADLEDGGARQTSSRPTMTRQGSGEVDLPPRTSSVTSGRASPARYDSGASRRNVDRNATTSRDTLNSSDSSMSSNTMQNMPVIAPYPQEDTMPSQDNPPPQPPSYNSATNFPHPPPPPPKQQDALAALQRGGELERRASRRFSQYQIHKQLGTGIPMIPPSQNSPIPNRGRDARESMNAVRIRGSLLHTRQKSYNQETAESSPSRKNNNKSDIRRISEESSLSNPPPVIKPPPEPAPPDSPTVKTPEDKIGPSYGEPEATEEPFANATVSAPLDEQAEAEALTHTEKPPLQRRPPSMVPARHGSRKRSSPSPPQSQQFVPEQSPQPGKELTLFLQYKSKIKKFVLADGYDDLSIARLQLAFIEKFAWNTHNNGVDLPEIYIQDPISGVRHELEDLNDIKDRSVLVLNVEALDEVKRHIDDGIGGLRRIVEGIKTTVENQQSALQRVSDRQQEAAKGIASIVAAPPSASTRSTNLMNPSSSRASATSSQATADQLSKVQSLRRDLAVVRQTYSSFASDIEASMADIRAKASTVKSAAVKAAVPTLTGDTGRAYVNHGKKTLHDDSEKIVSRVDEVQDAVEDLRKDVVTRGVRPLPRQLETVAKDIQVATAELKKMQEFLRKEKPLWTKIWEQELQVVCDDRDELTMQEELAADLEDDLEKASQTFALVEQATKQQMQQTAATQGANGASSSSAAAGMGRSPSANLRAVALDQAVDPRKAKDGVLGEVRALQPNHETRLEAIERAERARQRELESRRGGEFQKELGSFVEEGRLKKSGGVEEAERLRMVKDERARRENWERAAARAAARVEGAGTGAANGGPVPPLPDATATAEAKGNGGAVPVADAAEVPLPAPASESLEVPTASDDGGTNSPEPEFVEAKEEPPTPAPEEGGTDEQPKHSSWLTSFIGR